MSRELNPYKFYTEGNMDVREEDDKSITAWIPYSSMQEFIDIFEDSLFDDGGLKAVMTYDSICVCLSDILEYYGLSKKYYCK